MKRLVYLPIAILASIPVTGFAHKVPYGNIYCALSEEEAEFEQIRLCTQEEKDKSAATAFCTFMGRSDLENCAESITSHGMADAAQKCVDEALQNQIDFKDELVGHKVGGGKDSGSNGHWHTDYRYSKEEGMHRHDWSEAAREKAGAEYATARVKQAKEASATNKTTSESTTNWNVGGVFKAIFGGPVAEVGGETSANQGGGKTNTVENGPISDAKAQEIYQKAFDQAKADPNLSTVNPNILCERDKPNCSTSFSRDYKNEDYKPESKKPESSSSTKESSSSSGSSSSGSQGSSTSHTPPKTSSRDEVGIKHTHTGTYAGDPSPVTKPGEMLATWDKDNLNSPISRCLIEEIKEQVSQDMNKTYNPDGPNLTPEERKKEAEGLLRKGVCNVQYYGQAFCQKHKTFQLTGGTMQDPREEDKTKLFEEMQDLGKYDFANPNDDLDWTPIDLSKRPNTSPDSEKPRTPIDLSKWPNTSPDSEKPAPIKLKP